MVRWNATGWLLILAVLPCAAKPFTGPFCLNDGLTFYVVNPTGQAFDLKVTVMQPWRKDRPTPTLLRVFDPQERLVLRHEWPGDVVLTPEPDTYTGQIAAAGPGVYQVVVNGGYSVSWARSTVELQTTPELEFGVFGSLQYLTGVKDQFADSYVHLPPGLPKLPITATDQLVGLKLLDEAGTEKLALDKGKLAGETALPSGEHVWRLQATGDFYRLDFKGYPIILCPSAESAKAIHAGVDVMPDGTVCFHKHQVAAWKLLQQYKQRPASDYTVQVEPIETLLPGLLKEPGRNTLLFGYYGVLAQLPPILASQNLDSKSPWFGAIHTWRDKEGKAKPGNPLADYDRTGLEAFAALNKDLAALYFMKADFNPYYHNPKLLNRIIIGALLDQMAMREGEYCNVSNTYYGGIHAFTLEHSHSGAFSLVYSDVPPDVQTIWRAGQQRLTDRFLYTTVGGCTNQWTILLVGLWRYFEGTGEEEYKQAVLRNTHWLIDNLFQGQRPAGYMTEANGPDATYNGITGHSLSEIYHHSQDPRILESLRKAYNLFNHTIAPEPDGTWLGSSGYCHRTPGDWVSPQYGAGLGPMSGNLPEAGLRYPGHGTWAYYEPITDEAGRQKAEDDLRKTAHYLPESFFELEAANTARASGAFDINFANWRIYENKYLPGKLPCLADEPFTRNFGDEFFCVKRPTYYAFLYCGVAYQEWQMGVRPRHCDEQYPANDGLCMFWSPGFGVSLLTKNWGQSRCNTLLCEVGEGQVLWPYYMDTKSKLDTEAGTAELTGKIRETPLSYRRAYRFLDDGVECALTIKSDADFTCRNLRECLPYPLSDIKPDMHVGLLDAQGEAVESGQPAATLRFTNAAGQGHSIVFATPAPIALGQDETVDHYGGKHTYGRALVSLPNRFTAGQEVVLQYRLMPTP